ncbi:hypothetical protein SAMN05216227_105914 [Pseudorhodobacter antarcticus]|uniref:Uncharacterized protein n=1 Tax=Pseudorhodobacter antarcticus TaxID=1077947 RepID=A0A1H8MQF7_9RHOB|nr:hypothetical protein [Pseudorhodobacter antarcticus]SEO19577.1 hypothetical protein SAMN05216227_105914 [Pseudorhodobacter antarcticus]
MFNPPYDASTWIPYFEVLLELIRAIAWPTAVIIAALLFSKDLKSLLPRIKKVGPAGLELETVHQNSEGLSEVRSTAVSESPLGELTDAEAKRIEERNERELQAFPEEHHLKILLRALTMQELYRYFALAYANIFTSQIILLEILNSRKIGHEEADELFKSVQANHDQLKDWKLETYMRFLLNWNFIKDLEGTYGHLYKLPHRPHCGMVGQ